MTPADPSPTLSSFAPIEGERVVTLVLGSMPGAASLSAEAYYAHPRNGFWPIVLAWLEGGPPGPAAALAMPYPQRVARLRQAGIGVWDVLAHCHRPGSLDSAIVRTSEVPNDIEGFVMRHPELQRIVFNGRTAERLFERHVDVSGMPSTPRRIVAPSTSPAMASLNLEAKHALWSEALGTPASSTGRNGSRA